MVKGCLLYACTVLRSTIKQIPGLQRAHRLLGEKGMSEELVLASPLIISIDPDKLADLSVLLLLLFLNGKNNSIYLICCCVELAITQYM